MTKEQLLALGVPEDMAAKVAAASTEELAAYIPKTRFDELEGVKKQLEADVTTRDKQLEDLKKSTGDVKALQDTITMLQEKNKTDKADFDAKLAQTQKDNAVELALVSANPQSDKAKIGIKALLGEFLNKAEVKDGVVVGLEGEIKKLKEAEDSKFFFKAAKEGAANTFRGIVPGESADGQPSTDSPKTLQDAVKAHFEAAQAN